MVNMRYTMKTKCCFYFVEIFVQFLGNIQNVPIDLDMTRRTEVLRLIDMGKVKYCLCFSAKVKFAFHFYHKLVVYLHGINILNRLFQKLKTVVISSNICSYIS